MFKKVDNAVLGINHHPVDNANDYHKTYPLDSNLSSELLNNRGAGNAFVYTVKRLIDSLDVKNDSVPQKVMHIMRMEWVLGDLAVRF